MWPWLIGLAAAVIKTFAARGSSAASMKVGGAVAEKLGPDEQRRIIAASQPGADRLERVGPQRQLLDAFRGSEAFRQQILDVFESEEPQAVAVVNQVESQLRAAPQLTLDIVGGKRAVSDALDPACTWAVARYDLSEDQLRFLRSDHQGRAQCPAGGEDLGLVPGIYGAVQYVDAASRPVNPLTFHAGFARDPLEPANWIRIEPEDVEAVCRNGHRWDVFVSD